MKICFISNPHSVHIQRWARAFEERGHEVFLLWSHIFSIDGVKMIQVDLQLSHVEFFPLRWYLLFRNTLKRRWILHKLKPDIIHVHELTFGWANLGFWKTRNLVVSTWGSDILVECQTTMNKFSKRFLMKQASVITATTQFLAKATTQYLSKERDIRVIPFGVDCSIFKPSTRKRANEAITLGFIKSLEPKYGPGYLIETMYKVAKIFPNVSLLLVGDGELELKLKTRVSQLGLEEKVHFIGKVPHKEIPGILQQVDIFVMPSISESFGVAAIEAGAMGIPVVASRIGGIPEAVEDGITGILVSPRDPEGLSKAILTLILNAQLREKMGHAARDYVIRQFNWEKSVEEMERIYKCLLEKNVKQR